MQQLIFYLYWTTKNNTKPLWNCVKICLKYKRITVNIFLILWSSPFFCFWLINIYYFFLFSEIFFHVNTCDHIAVSSACNQLFIKQQISHFFIIFLFSEDVTANNNKFKWDISVCCDLFRLKWLKHDQWNGKESNQMTHSPSVLSILVHTWNEWHIPIFLNNITYNIEKNPRKSVIDTWSLFQVHDSINLRPLHRSHCLSRSIWFLCLIYLDIFFRFPFFVELQIVIFLFLRLKYKNTSNTTSMDHQQKKSKTVIQLQIFFFRLFKTANCLLFQQFATN